jgi:hypothetical protein
MRRSEVIRHIQAPDFKNRVEIMSGFNSDIIDVIHYNLPRAKRQVREIANFFKGADDLSTSRKIWDFLKKEIKYVKDPAGQQDIRLPGRFVAEGKGDCKSYSLFTGAILSNLGIPFSFRYASYSASDPTPQHVYVVTDSGVIIDAVWHSFNSEKKPSHKKDYPMKIQTLSGIGCTSCNNTSAVGSVMIGDIGKINLKKAAKKVTAAVKKPVLKNVQSAVKKTAVVKAASKIQTKAKNTGIVKAASKLQSQVKSGGLKAVIGAGPRRAYRTLIALNFRGWATKLASNTPKAKELWAKAGGSWSELEQSINVGKNKKALFGSKNQTIKTVNGIGEVTTAATVGTILALAAPIIALFKSLTKDDGGATSVPGDDTAGENGSTGDALKDIVTNVSNLFTGNQRPDTAAPQTQSAETSETPSTQTSTVSTGLMLGAAALAAFLFLK